MSEKDNKTENNRNKKEGEKKPANTSVQYERLPGETSYDAKKRIKKEMASINRKGALRSNAPVIGVAAAALAVIIGICGAKAADAGDYIRINDEKISESEFNYYFNSTYNSMAQIYSSYMGLDTTQPLDQQMYDETQTYQDMFEQQAVNNIIYNHALLKDAKENGFSYDPSGDVKEQMDSLSEQLAESESDLSLNSYFSQYYGVREKDARKYIGDSIKAEKYYDSLADTLGATEEEVNAKYEEDKDDYDRVEYVSITVNSDIPEEIDIYSDELSEVDQQTVDAAYQEARQKAEAISHASDLNEMKNLAVQYGVVESADEIESTDAVGHDYVSDGEWLFGDRKPGDITVVNDDDYYYATVYYFINREKPTEHTKNVYVYSINASYEEDADETAIQEEISSIAAEAEALLAAYNETEKTADAFKELNYNDMEATEYKNSDRDNLPQAIADWVFSDERSEGDTEIIEDGETYYVVYFAGDGPESWFNSVKSALDSEKISEYVQKLTDAYEVSDPKGNLHYLAAAEESESTSESSESSASIEE